ncbi:hypothetical protein TRFO_32859 [Tritrichomonas foetus]|uniref:Uncharacterized protein n=1 Tax=Tritrichomonas foetus TaxID=1144522 RepID=A0A1J4JT58_9EUKA|nr:hypothetical protein TRFO_32859 [Tritrichomonas foetus]|eukprot:OHT00453.1 hypothetical protein TRFO_32859 [Tritrichomonas foetus]
MKDDNLSLRTQYEEAMNLTKQMDEIHQENTVLTRKVHKLTAEKDEINRRLQISLQMNEDLKKKCEQTPVVNIHENNELRESLESANKKHQQQITDLNNVVQETTQMLNAVRNESADLKNTINNIVEAAESYFGETFSSHESLRQFLLIPQTKIEIPNINEKHIKSPHKVNISMLNSLKLKAKNERNLRKEMYHKLLSAEKENQNQKEQFYKTINNLENKIAEIQKDSKDNELKQKQELATSESQLSLHMENVERMRLKIQQLKEQNERLEEIQKRPNPLASEVSDLQRQLADRNNKIKENNSSIASLKKQISSLISQLKQSEIRINSLKKKVSDIRALNDEINEELVDLRTEKGKLEIINDELNEKFKTVSAQLKVDKSSTDQNKARVEQLESNYTRLKSSNNLMQNILDKQKDEINLLYNEREKLIHLIQQLNAILKASEIYYQNKIIEKQMKPEKKKKVETKIVETIVEPTIPITSWFSTEFPRELTTMIGEVAKNEALPITAKLRHILNVIGKFYNSQNFEQETKLKNKDEQFSSLSDKFSNFLLAIGAQIDVDLNNVADPIKPIIEWIVNLKDQMSIISSEKDTVKNEINYFLDKLDFKSLADAESDFVRLRGEFYRVQSELHKEKKKSKQHKKSQKELGHTFVEHQREIEIVFNKQKGKIENLEKTCDEYIIEVRQLKNKNAELTNEIIRIKNEHEDQVGEVTVEKDAFLKQLRDEYEKEKIELVSMLEDKTAKIESYCKEIVRLEKEVSQWKRTAETMKKQKKEKERELEEIANQFNESDNDWKERLIKEKTNLTTQFRNLVAELKGKNKELRALVIKTAEALNESEDNVKKLSAHIADLEATNQENHMKLSSLKDEMEREKQLIETKIKAKNLSSEMKCQALLEEEKSRQETEKRKLFGFVAKSFRHFFDGKTQLTDECFKSVIKSASYELERLLAEEAAMKRLLGIGPTESPQDSVAKLLLSLYRPSE